MKKINKKLSLGLAICLLASPIATNLDTAYAQEIEESVDTLSFEDFKKEYEDFKKTQAYEILEDEKKEKLDQAFSSINEENFSQENYNNFHSLLNDIEISYLSLIYDPLYKELGELNKENLSDELKEEIESYKPSFETIEEYDLAIEDIPKSKEKIEAYNKELQDKKDLLKKGLDQVKDTDIDLEDEKKVLENEASKVKEVDQAIESLNKKIEDYNKRISEKLKLDRKKIFDKLNEDYKNLKDDIIYKKSSKKDRQDLDKLFENTKKAYEENNKEDFESLKDSFYQKAKSIDGIGFVDLLKEIIGKVDNEENNLSKDKKEYYINKINQIKEEDSAENMENLQNLNKELDEDLEDKGGSVRAIAVTDASSDDDSDSKNKDNKRKVAC